jgi:hypothetical protein
MIALIMIYKFFFELKDVEKDYLLKPYQCVSAKNHLRSLKKENVSRRKEAGEEMVDKLQTNGRMSFLKIVSASFAK